MAVRHALVVAILVCFPLTAAAQPATRGRFVEGTVLVKFQPGAAASAKADAHRSAGGTVLAETARTRIQLVSVPAGSETAALARYRSNPNVLYAEPDYIRSIPEPLSHEPGTEIVPGEFHFDEQWALNNTGQMFMCLPLIGTEFCFYVGTPDADIDAPEAWAITTGSADVSVAVIDSGIDYTHPDLAMNYAGGYDFFNGDADPMDDHGHGTHVSGTIAAAIGNLTGNPPVPEGVVGVAPHARLFVYKVCGADGSCTDDAIIQALEQAVADGAKVVNMSLGSPDFSEALADEVQDTWNAGLVIVAGAGNEGNTNEFFPAALDNVISVAAFDEDHRRASFSTYGDWVDISAPGNVILSTYPLSACGGLTTVPGDTGCYNWLSGTSMASPHVAGAAALVWSRPDVTSNSQVAQILLDSADPKGRDAVRLDSWTIHGGLNLHDALSLGSLNVPPVADAGPDQTVADADTSGTEAVTLDGTGSSDTDGSVVGYAWSESGTFIGSGATPMVTLSVGVHTLTLTVTDDGGATGTDTVVVTVTPGNQPPVAASTAASTVVGTPVAIALSGTDAESCELTFSIVQGPGSGILGGIGGQVCAPGTPNSDFATVTYTPTESGSFSFTYKVNDGSVDSNIATVTITVDPSEPPPAEPLTVTAINPAIVSQSAGVVTFTITGTGFADGAGVAFFGGSGPAPQVRSVARVSSTQLTAVVEIRSGGPKRNREWSVQVTNPGGSTAVGAALLTITP